MKQSLKKYWLEIILHLIFWVLVFEAISYLTSVTVKYLKDIRGIEQKLIVKNSLYPVSFVFHFILMVLFYINSFWVFTRVVVKKKYYGVITSIVFAVMLYILNYFLVNQCIAFSTLDQNEWKHLQGNVLLIFGFIWGLSLAYFFSKDWFKNEVLRKKMESHQLSTELNFLKSQINPHFLFNTLNNLFSIAQERQNDELANGISKLSEMMRYMIYESNAEKVPLQKEIEYLNSFIVLNKLRFNENELNVHFSYPENCKGEMIAPILFIPFVENALKYGILINENSEIKIMIQISDLGILFSCENSDYSFVNKMKDTVKGIGLDNVRRRLELIYPNAHSLEIKNENKKYSVLLQLYKK